MNSAGNIYRREGGGWTEVPGALAQVSVGSATRIWGVNKAGKIYQWTGGGWAEVPGGLSNVSAAGDGTLWGVSSGGGVYYYVPPAALIVSNPRLGEADLERDEKVRYLFDVTNTAPGTVLQNVQLKMLYDPAAFAAAGITVTPDAFTLTDPLPYGRTVTVGGAVIAAAATARPGAYGFHGVSATFDVVPVPAQSVPISSGAGGWLPFNVVP